MGHNHDWHIIGIAQEKIMHCKVCAKWISWSEVVCRLNATEHLNAENAEDILHSLKASTRVKKHPWFEMLENYIKYRKGIEYESTKQGT